MNAIRIAKAGLKDIEKLQDIGRQTFYETFAEGNTEENMQKYLEEGFSNQKLHNELSDPHSEFYLALVDTRVVGYLKVNSGQAQTELKDSKSLEIERIYVLNEFHGRQVGQLLYDKAIELAKLGNVSYVWLGVWEKNPRAIQFYKKNGFVEFDKHIFKLGDDEQIDFMMRLDLSRNPNQ